MEISIVIPIYNSVRSIEELVRRIIMVMEEKKTSFEIILVDDQSSDESLSLIQTIAAKDWRIRVLALEKNHGQQAATKNGMALAKGDLIVTMDDDLEQQPEDIPKLMETVKQGFDVVYGVIKRDAYPFYRQWGSYLVDLFLTHSLGKPAKIRVGCFRILNRKTCDFIVNDQTPFVYVTAITLKLTKNIGNVDVSYQERQYGRSNYNLKKLMKLFFNLFYHYRKAI